MQEILSIRLRSIWQQMHMDLKKIQEIRLRIGQPWIIRIDCRDYFVTEKGQLVRVPEQAVCIRDSDLKETMSYICRYSLYAYEDEMRQGFVTIKGGHRIGIAGSVVMKDGKIMSIAYVMSMNIRVAHECIGCACELYKQLWDDQRPYRTLIISTPGGGKTTILRDLVRLFSDGFAGKRGLNVGLVDERSEISACDQGIPQNQIGIRTDVIERCSKAEGIRLLVRSMSPELIIFDELGNASDIEAVKYARSCGCSVLATLHGDDMRSVQIQLNDRKENVFERFVFLKGRQDVGTVACVMDGKGTVLCGG